MNQSIFTMKRKRGEGEEEDLSSNKHWKSNEDSFR
jgi:hypothetical protein